MRTRYRHKAILGLVLTALGIHSLPAEAPAPRANQADARTFSFATLQQLAQERAGKAYEDRSPALPDALAKLTYDQYRDIRFKSQNALWRGRAPFEVQFFHRGHYFKRRVNINEVSASGVRTIPYSAAAFDFGRANTLRAADLPGSVGFAGFRVHFPLHNTAYKDELAVFLGASYFKVLGRNQGYGISARGLAVDTAGPRGEEFPEFTDFWLVKPAAHAQQLTLYALLDSRNITGAYRFDIKPGDATQVKVTSTLYPRQDIEKLGIAPLTSMYLFGENVSERRFEDFRPEVHDSDGLQAQTGRGEWLWRPVVNPAALRIVRLVDENPKGFGLSQRDRDFDHYQDNEALYERRPDYWVQPLGKWGKGSVELVEIPTDEEINDNIVSYWVPEAPVRANKPLNFSYVLTSQLQVPAQPSVGRAVATRMGRLNNLPPNKDAPDTTRRVIVDFTGGALDKLENTQPVVAAVSGTNADIHDITVQRLATENVWRAAFQVKPKSKDPVDMRCVLTLKGKPLTESWLYLWTP